jgi:hypothetical protein
MHAQAGNRAAALGHLTLSLLDYPLPYGRAFVRYPLGRIRLLVASLLNPGNRLARAS